MSSPFHPFTVRSHRWLLLALLVAVGSFSLPEPAAAARISDITETNIVDRAVRFFTMQDRSLRYALIGSLLLGVSCGLMGAFLVVRKLALMSDSLSHAVLPGVALGFLWTMTKNPFAIFIGATIAGLLGAGVVQAIRSTTKQKEDASLGFVLAAFYAVGICLMTMIQNLPGGSKSGLDKFMFGQVAALSQDDILLLGGVTLLAVLLIFIFYKEFLLTSFDPSFARSAGLPTQIFHYLLMLLLAFSIVASLQAVGVILVAAMLVIPAASAYLLTDRMGWMLMLSAIFGMCSGAVGAFFSFVGRNLPTGPLMVMAAAVVFVLALFFGPRHGIFARWWRHRSRSKRIQRENTLKAIYRILESEQFLDQSVSLTELAEHRRETIEEASHQLHDLKQCGLVTMTADRQSSVFTPAGWQRACEIVRNHRLWELYLTNAANYASDHVHEDAERIEHVLGEEMVRKLERRLQFAHRDPHGKLIPSQADIQSGGPTPRSSEAAVGYGAGPPEEPLR